MDDMEKDIKGIETCNLNGGLIGNCPYKGILALLKEQEDLGTELTNAVELIHKKNERIEKLLKERKAVEPVKIKSFPMPMYFQFGYECGNCETPLLKDQPYCAGCGKPVKWND